MSRHAQLAHQKHVQRNIQSAGDFVCYRHAAARQRHHQNFRAIRILAQFRSQLTAGISSIVEEYRHDEPRLISLCVDGGSGCKNSLRAKVTNKTAPQACCYLKNVPTMTFAEARACVLDRVRALGYAPPVEEVELDAASGRVLAEDLHADRDYPAVARSVRDGFAVRAIDLPGTLEIDGAH